MGKIIMVGCDLHDKNMLLKIAVGRAKAAKKLVVNTGDGRQALIEQLWQQAQAAGAAKIVFAYEASGQGYQLYDELTAAGILCYVLAPTKIARSHKHKKSKTDEKDAERLLELLRAHVLAGNALPTVRVPTPQQRDDQELVRTRTDLASKQTRLKAQIRALLKRKGCAVADAGRGWTRAYRAGLQRLCAQGLEHGAAVALQSLLRQLAQVEDEIEVLDGELRKLGQQARHAKQVQALTKISGVGVYSALLFLVEMGDLKRFENRRQIGSYAGLVPSSNETGETNDRKGHITRQGSARLRKALCQSVWALLRSDSGERTFYERLKRKNPKKAKIAVVAVMRRLAIRMWHVAQAA